MTIGRFCVNVGKTGAITPGARLWARAAARPILGVERLTMHGFPFYLGKTLQLSEEQLCHLAGNSFNGFNVVPIIIAMFANVLWPLK
jgi:hypothetical protein